MQQISASNPSSWLSYRQEANAILVLLLVEFLLPLGLGLWLMVKPPSDWLTFGLLGLAVLFVSSSLILTGLWTLLPWWWPWLCAAIALVGVLRCALLDKSRWLPSGVQWAASVAAAGLAISGAWLTIQGVAGRRLPISAVELAFPLPPGNYLVANGGANIAVSSHAETLDLSVPRHRLWHGQSYGVDIVALSSVGRSAEGLMPTNPKQYVIYGRTVLAPCTGLVISAASGLPDTAIPLTSDEPSVGNHVLLRCEDVEVLLAHFKPGSLRVRQGQRVAVGQPVAEVGNSGSSSEPHLHIHAQSPGTTTAPFSGQPLPIQFDGRSAMRNDRL